MLFRLIFCIIICNRALNLSLVWSVICPLHPHFVHVRCLWKCPRENIVASLAISVHLLICGSIPHFWSSHCLNPIYAAARGWFSLVQCISLNKGMFLCRLCPPSNIHSTLIKMRLFAFGWQWKKNNCRDLLEFELGSIWIWVQFWSMWYARYIDELFLNKEASSTAQVYVADLHLPKNIDSCLLVLSVSCY